MNIKNKIKWKILVILLSLLSIFLLYFFAVLHQQEPKAKEEWQEELLKENERASIQMETKTKETPIQTAKEETPIQTTPIQTTKEETLQRIRVLLKSNDFASNYHEKVSLQVSGEYVMIGSETVTLSDKTCITIDRESPYFSEGILQFIPSTNESNLCFLSIQRAQGNPCYAGEFTLYLDENGIRVVNELPLETYLQGVVPSEMPASYESEALKAQAVCARTYAYVQIKNNKLAALDAHVDDSVSYQVYQNVAPNPRTTQAIEDTKDEILCREGIPIDAYYFSTSHGKTSTDEVWEAAAPAAFLKSVVCEYDKEEPWYQWQIHFTKKQLLSNIQKEYPSMKDLTRIIIVQVGEGDAVLGLQLEGQNQSLVIHNEYSIRQLFSPKGMTITRQDGSKAEGGSLLPSAYFTLEEIKEGDALAGYIIHGGGYGHGVGMSQNGAQHMALIGSKKEEILQYFYNEIDIIRIADIVTASK